MIRFIGTVRLALLVAGIAAAISQTRVCSEPGEDAILKLIADLGNEDPAVRDAASRKLVEAGPAVLLLLERELAAGKNLEAEVAARLRQCIERIRTAELQARLWKRPPEEDVAAWFKKHPCGCDRPQWEIEEVKDELLVRWLPRARVFLFITTCCKGRRYCMDTLIVGREPDAVERTTGAAGLQVLKDHLRPARNLDEAREAGDVAFALNLMARLGKFTIVVGGYAPKTAVTETNDGYLYEYGVNRITFDAEGRLKNSEIVSRK